MNTRFVEYPRAVHGDRNDAEEYISIHADAPGRGGASHGYLVMVQGETTLYPSGRREYMIAFQCGPVAEVGANGLTHEALLTIIADRLRQFQSGPYCCRENALALTKVEEALFWLDARTRGRQRRGVEGTNKV